MTVAAPAPKWYPWAVTGAVVGVLATVRIFEKQVTPFLPGCPLHALTGLHCPGCGATRAVRALMHGDIVAAWNFNQLFIILLPLLGIFFAQLQWSPRPFRGSAKLGFSLFAIIFLFGVLRNIPVAPFNLLAPH